MKTRQRLILTLTALGFVAAAGAAIGIRAAVDDDGDETMTLAQCPAAVRATIQAHLGGGTITEIERTTDHGGVRYEVDVTGAPGRVEFNVGADGTYLGKETDDDGPDDDDGDDGADEDGDVQVTLDQCPGPVQATIHQVVGEGAINEIERSPAGNYEVDANGPDGQFEFVVAADGTYLGGEDDQDEDDGDDEGR